MAVRILSKLSCRDFSREAFKDLCILTLFSIYLDLFETIAFCGKKI